MALMHHAASHNLQKTTIPSQSLNPLEVINKIMSAALSLVKIKMSYYFQISYEDEEWGWWGATNWQVNPLRKLKTAKWYQLVLFSAHITHKTAKSMLNLTSRLCGDL